MKTTPATSATTTDLAELLALGRGGEALALVEREDDAEALELQARSLRALGREAEADAAERRLVELAGDRSELRLRAQKPLQM